MSSGADELVAMQAPAPAPVDYTLKPRESFTPTSVYAIFDGSGAAGAFLPCCTIYSQDGRVLSRTFPAEVAAGDVAEVTYAPFLKAASTPGAAGTPPPTGGGTVWLTGGYRGAIFSDPSLLAYYRLGAPPNTQVDEVTQPSTAPLTKHAGAVAGSSVTGPPQIADGNNAFEFNALATADGDYFFIPTNTPKFTGVLTDWSMECWLWPSDQQPRLNNAQQGVNRGGIFADRAETLGVRNGWALVADYAAPFGGAAVGLSLVPGGLDAPAIGPFTLVGGGAVNLAASWYHVAVVHNAHSNTTSMYVNGALVGTFVGPSGTSGFTWIANQPTYIGVNFPIDLGGTNRQRGFVGIIDEVAIYNRTLPQSEILLHYNASGLDGDTGHWVSVGYTGGAAVGDSAVDTAQLTDSAVTTAKIADSAVTSAKIADGTIVVADISATLKPSGTAAAATEALRALGTTASTATAGNDARLFQKATPVYSAAITPNAAAGAWQTITVANAVAFTINAPTNPPAAGGTQELTVEVFNNSGGAMGAVTWNAAFVLVGGAFVNPAATKRRYISFKWNGTSWVEQSRASADY